MELSNEVEKISYFNFLMNIIIYDIHQTRKNKNTINRKEGILQMVDNISMENSNAQFISG
uniref:Uncharacterized protein n=1 Tax=Romanomermis culicivorax TaxID=13658 RepID=A0A915JD86_ROMCU